LKATGPRLRRRGARKPDPKGHTLIFRENWMGSPLVPTAPPPPLADRFRNHNIGGLCLGFRTMRLATNPMARPITKAEQDDFDTVLKARGARGDYSVAPDLGKTNWASFPLVRILDRGTGRAFTYYRHPAGHRRYWVSQFSEALGQTVAEASAR